MKKLTNKKIHEMSREELVKTIRARLGFNIPMSDDVIIDSALRISLRRLTE